MTVPFDALVCFIVFAVVLVFQTIFKRNQMSPGALYILIIIGTLGISFLNLMPAMTPFKPFTWITIVGSSISFIVGTIIVRIYFYSQGIILPRFSIDRDAVVEIFARYNWRRHLKITASLIVLYGIAVVRFLFKYDAPTIFSKSMLNIVGKAGIDIGYLYLPLVTYPLLLMLILPCTSIHTKLPKWWRVLCKILFLAMLLIGFSFWPARGALMTFFIFAVAYYNAVVRRIQIRHFMLLGVGIIIMFILVANLKKQIDSTMPDSKIWKLPYSYIANNYWNLDYAINPPSDRELHPLTWGHQTLGGFLGLEFWPDWMSIRTAYHWDGLFNERVEKVRYLNTNGYWWRLYKDYWVFGTMVFPFFGGLWQGWMYNRVRFSPDLPFVLVYAYMTVFIVLSFFCDFWGMGTAPIYLLGLWVISKTCATPAQLK